MNLFIMAKNNKNKNKQPEKTGKTPSTPNVSPNLIRAVADEVARMVIRRLPRLVSRKKKTGQVPKKKLLENSFFLDTSAIIDSRIFDVINMGLVYGNFVVLESILLELKHIADAQDSVKRLRGRKGLELLENLKRNKKAKIHVIPDGKEKTGKEVDERLISSAKAHKGRIITCDYNLEKKSTINGVLAINVNTLANILKVIAVPGEALYIKILHVGKDATQGVGYLDDGTMIVVENASRELGQSLDVMVSRVIQTTAGRILFAKKI